MHMDAHGIHRGFAWYRGRFTGPIERIIIDAQHSYDVFLNGVRLASPEGVVVHPGEETSQVQAVEVPAGLCRAPENEEENVLAVLVESLGHGTGFSGGAPNPLGLLSCALDPARPIAWRVRGGLWHEGAPDTLAWRDEPIQEDDPAIAWHRTAFTLDLPANHRVPLGLRIADTPGKVLVYLNGLLVGRYWGEMGPQTLFYLPDGLLRSRDRNELVLAHWHHPQNTARAGGSSGSLGPVSLEAYPAYRRVTLCVQHL
jgi:beta-galactosidase